MKKIILIAVLLLVGVTYGQNYAYPIGLYSYESLTILNSEQRGVDPIVEITEPLTKQSPALNYNSSVGLINYEDLQNYNKTEGYKLAEENSKTKAQAHAEKLMALSKASRDKIVIRKAPKEVLVRYEGKHTSLKLFDFNGEEVKANYSKKYRGLIIPRSKEHVNYFLEVKNEVKSKTYYHQVSL